MAETRFSREVFARHGARPDVRLFRNTVGHAWHGDFRYRADKYTRFDLQPGDVVIRGGRRITAGLAPGSADVVGIRAVPLSALLHLPPETLIGRFTSLELKDQASTQDNQEAWYRTMLRFGALAGICHSMDEVDALLGPKP